jgi:TPR repeat protein
MVTFWIIVWVVWFFAALILSWVGYLNGYGAVLPFLLIFFLGPFVLFLATIVLAASFVLLVWAVLGVLCARYARQRGEPADIVFAISLFLSPLAALLWIHRSSIMPGGQSRTVPASPVGSKTASNISSRTAPAVSTPASSDEAACAPQAEGCEGAAEDGSSDSGPVYRRSWEDIQNSLEEADYRLFCESGADPERAEIASERVRLLKSWKALSPDVKADRHIFLKDPFLFPALDQRIRQELGDQAPQSDGRPVDTAAQRYPEASEPNSIPLGPALVVVLALLSPVAFFLLYSTPTRGSSRSVPPNVAAGVTAPDFSPAGYRRWGDKARAEGDLKEAVKWYKWAAVDGDVPSMEQLGMILDNGKGLAVDDQEAVRWYLKAAKAGSSMAAERLQVMYSTGEGVSSLGGKETFELDLWAAEQGIASAQLAVGKAYDQGIIIEEDDVQAAHWYRMALTEGEPEAASQLLAMFDRGESTPDTVALRNAWRERKLENKLATADRLISGPILSHFSQQSDFDLKAITSSRLDIDGDDLDEFLVVSDAAMLESPNTIVQDLIVLKFGAGQWSIASSDRVGASATGLADSSTLALEDGQLTLMASRFADDDKLCCPSQKAKLYFNVLSGGGAAFDRELILSK